MALSSNSLFLYGYTIDSNTFSIDFRTAPSGPIFMASLKFGFYSLTDLLIELKRAMEAADPLHRYTWTADRTLSGGTQNRITVNTNGGYLELDFGTGPRMTTSVAVLIGFLQSDYSGGTGYTGSFSSGKSVVSERVGYNYLSPDFVRSIFGAVNVSASGLKEAIVWNIQRFTEIEFMYEPEAKVISEWTNFLTWAIQQKSYEFTPQIKSPNSFYNVTLESTASDGKGLGYRMTEQLPDFPFNYKTGMLKMRIKEIV